MSSSAEQILNFSLPNPVIQLYISPSGATVTSFIILLIHIDVGIILLIATPSFIS